MMVGYSMNLSADVPMNRVSRDMIFEDDKSVNIWTSLIVDHETPGSFLVHVKGDGQTVMFNGLLMVSCSINKSSWLVGRNWLNGKYTENDVKVVPERVISLIQKKYCSKK